MRDFIKAALVAVCVLLGAAAASFLAGCATFAQNDNAARLSVQYATLKWVGEDAGRAERALEVIETIRPYAQGPTTLSALDNQVREQIRWDRLDAADSLLLDALLIELRAELEARMGDGLLSPEHRTRIETVLGWVEQAVHLAGR